VSLNGGTTVETMRAQLPDLAGVDGRMSVFGIIEPRLYELCEQVAVAIGRGPVQWWSDHQEDDGVDLGCYGEPGFGLRSPIINKERP
jgi:hypothetical protein